MLFDHLFAGFSSFQLPLFQKKNKVLILVRTQFKPSMHWAGILFGGLGLIFYLVLKEVGYGPFYGKRPICGPQLTYLAQRGHDMWTGVTGLITKRAGLRQALSRPKNAINFRNASDLDLDLIEHYQV